MNRIKRIAMQLIERYDGVFTTDFESNKQLLNKIAVFRSKELRNEVAGYITRYMMGSSDLANKKEEEGMQEQEE
jgi:Ribosomal protein S17E